MTAGDVTDGERHRQHREAERQRDTEQTDAHIREGCGEDCAAAAAQDEPEGSEKLGGIFIHVVLPRSRLLDRSQILLPAYCSSDNQFISLACAPSDELGSAARTACNAEHQGFPEFT